MALIRPRDSPLANNKHILFIPRMHNFLMGLKKFLSPTPLKLALAAVIYLAFVPIIQYCIMYSTGPGILSPGGAFQGCKYISLLETIFFLRDFNYLNWLFALAGIPASYAAACAIVLPFQKPIRV